MKVTDDMVERGARGLHELLRRHMRRWNVYVEHWEEIAESARARLRTEARACLEAAFGGDEDERD